MSPTCQNATLLEITCHGSIITEVAPQLEVIRVCYLRFVCTSVRLSVISFITHTLPVRLFLSLSIILNMSQHMEFW